MESDLDTEVDSLKAQLAEAKERSLSAETSLYNSKGLFKTNLKELKEKAAMLSSALDREVEAKNDIMDELSRVRAELERQAHDQKELVTNSSNKDRVLNQQLTEALRTNAVLDSDMKNAR